MTKSILPLNSKWHLPLIILASLLAYFNTLHHGFVLDDIAVVEGNKIVQKGFGGIPEILKTFYWKGYWDSNAGLYRPLSLITFAIEWQFSPNNPLIHHLFNIVYYILVCCLLYRLLLKWFPKINADVIFLVVFLFIVHPLHTEVVANIKSRDELLALLFFLLSANAFVPGSTKSVVLSSIYFFLSLLSKEGAIMLLPLLLIHIHISNSKETIGSTLKAGIPFFVVSAIWLLIHQAVIKSGPEVITYTYNDNALLSAPSVMEQKGTALGILARYFVKLVWPYEMSYDYSFSQIPIIGFFSALSLAGLAMLAGLVYAFVKLYKKDAFMSISIAFIVLPLILTSNIFMTIGATAADRFLFVSTIGSCMLLVYLPYKYLKPGSQTAVLRYGTLLLFVVFTSMTLKRNKAWKDNFSLFEADVKTVDHSARAHYNYGTGLMNLSKTPGDERGLEAKQEFEKCLSIDPNYFDALLNLGSIEHRMKNYPVAIDLYRRGIKLNKNSPDIYGNIGESFFRSGQNDSAIAYLKIAHIKGNYKIGTYDVMGTSYFNLKQYAEACKAFEEGIAKDATSAGLYMNYGSALAMSNRDREAIAAFEKAYAINSNNSQALYYIALTYDKLGDKENATKYYDAFKKTQGK